MGQCSNITHHESVNAFLQSSQKLSDTSVFNNNPFKFDTCSGMPTLAVFALIVLVNIVIFFINCSLKSKHYVENKLEFTISARDQHGRDGEENV